MTYHERVPASPVFRWFIWLVIAVAAAGGVVASLAEGPAWVGVVVVIGLFALTIIVDRWFMALRVDVAPEGVRMRFGPISKRLPARDVLEVVEEPYRWLSYGGWGIRLAGGKRRAWSVPFLKTGVAVALKDGSRYFISSKQPARLRAAIVQASERRGGTRG